MPLIGIHCGAHAALIGLVYARFGCRIHWSLSLAAAQTSSPRHSFLLNLDTAKSTRSWSSHSFFRHLSQWLPTPLSMVSNTANGSMTIWHADIFNIICQLRDKVSLKALRLVSYSIGEVATPYLFRTLILGLREYRLERLDCIPNSEKLAGLVRHIDGDTAHYYNEEPQFDEKLSCAAVGRTACKWSSARIQRSDAGRNAMY